MPLVKINNQSDISFYDWVKKWNELTASGINVTLQLVMKRAFIEHHFEVVERTALNIDNTFILRLKLNNKVAFQSGDLLAVMLPNSDVARKYSIAEINGDVLLSIRAHH